MDSTLRRALSARANRLKPSMAVGRGGVTDAVVAQLGRLFDSTDLLKVRVEAGQAGDADALVAALARRVGAELVRRIGKAAILYRPKDATIHDDTPT